jgi:hypothetical protein
MLGFVQEYRASSAVEKLRSQVTVKSSVLRDGKPQMIPSEQVVPGDLVLFSAAGRVGVIYYVLSKIGLCLCWMIYDTMIPESL